MLLRYRRQPACYINVSVWLRCQASAAHSLLRLNTASLARPYGRCASLAGHEATALRDDESVVRQSRCKPTQMRETLAIGDRRRCVSPTSLRHGPQTGRTATIHASSTKPFKRAAIPNPRASGSMAMVAQMPQTAVFDPIAAAVGRAFTRSSCCRPWVSLRRNRAKVAAARAETLPRSFMLKANRGEPPAR